MGKTTGFNTRALKGEASALSLDAADPLASYKEHFFHPPGGIYLVGNSLGLLSREAGENLQQTLEEWKSLAIDGWSRAPHPWISLAEETGAAASELVGAEPEELVMTASTTINIHALLASFYQPRPGRSRILSESLAFPSDLYALAGQIKLRGLDPERELLLIQGRDEQISEDEIIAAMGSDVALIFLPSVLYRGGQLLDMPRLAAAANERGIPIGFDCSHSAGVIPHRLSAWGVDFAVFCSYKYLNGGPGAPALLYLNRRHFRSEPLLAGWFGSRKDSMFAMEPVFTPAEVAGGWQISSPAIMSAAPLAASLKMIKQAGIGEIRRKSLSLTSFMRELLDKVECPPERGFSVKTPCPEQSRGGHLALSFGERTWNVCAALKKRGVTADFRQPDLLRLAPSPLYNSFHEVFLTVSRLQELLEAGEDLETISRPGVVT